MSAPETPARPLRKDAERNRRRVLRAARELFAARGLEPNLNDVARHAGVGVGTVYRRFPTKEDLLEAIFEDAMNQIAEFAEAALRQPCSWQGFVWFVERQCELTATDRGLREIAFSKAYGGDRVREARERLRAVTRRLVDRAQRDGHLRAGVTFTDIPLFGLIAGTVSEYAGNVDQDLWRRYVALLIDGMRSCPGQQPVPQPALEPEALDRAMQTWEPAGPPSHRPRC